MKRNAAMFSSLTIITIVVVIALTGCSSVREVVDSGVVDLADLTDRADVVAPVVPVVAPEPVVPVAPVVDEVIVIGSWGKDPAPGAKLDGEGELRVSADGVVWRWVRDPGWVGYRLGSGREIIATCYVAVPDGDGGWIAGKFDHWPADLVARNRHNIVGGYARVPVPEKGDTVYWFAVSGDRRRRSNFVKGVW